MRNKTVVLVYHKMVVLVGLMAELLAVQTLTDTAVLHLSTVGVAPFFVENISELQLSALRYIETICQNSGPVLILFSIFNLGW